MPIAPTAQAKVDDLQQKKAAADAKLAQAMTTLETLNYQSELPEGTGVVIQMTDVSKARANRDRAQDEVDRLAGALAEAQRRLSDAQAADEIEATQKAWARQSELASELRGNLDTVRAAFETAASLAAAYLDKREMLLKQHPAFKTVFANHDAGGMQMEGYDRLLRLSQLCGQWFHPNFRKHNASPHLTEIPEIVKREVLFLAECARRPIASPQSNTKPAA